MIETISLSLISDILIMVLLIATIVYAARLSNYLKNFKNSRADLQGIVTDLSNHITKAENAIKTLNDTVEISGEDLQARMKKANAMFDELDIVVQTGDNLANRLEELAVRNRKIVAGGDGDLLDLARATSDSNYDERVKKVVKTINEKDDLPSSVFSIRDREVESGNITDNDGFTLDDNDMLSEAERDLYEALKTKRTKGNQ